MSLCSVYFDLDGVLVDSFCIHQRAWATAFDSVGVTVTDDMTDDLRSIPAMAALQVCCKRAGVTLTDSSLSELGRLKDSIRDELIELLDSTSVYPWARGMLTECREREIRAHCIATTRAANRILEKIGLIGFFDSVTCGHAIDVPKRDGAQTLAKLIKNEGVSFDSSLYFDDAPKAIELAMRVGIPAYLVSEETRVFCSESSSIQAIYEIAIAHLNKYQC